MRKNTNTFNHKSKMAKKTYYEKIKARREELGLTRRAVATAIYGKGERTLANYYNLERGITKQIKFENLAKVGKALNMSLDEIFN